MKIINALIILTLISCGKDSPKGNNSVPHSFQDVPPGHYRVIFVTLNKDVGRNNASGTATINIIEHNFKVRLNLIDAPASVEHLQQIHKAAQCPGMEHDKNRDGILDVKEARSVSGPAMVSLDTDLNSQLEGRESFPSSDRSGSYVYEEEGPLESMLLDLKVSDLNLEGRQIIIYGISPSVILPQGVAAIEDHSAHAVLPIACGKIVKVHDETGQ